MEMSRTEGKGIRWIYFGLSTVFFLTAGAGMERWKAFEIKWIVTVFVSCLGILVFMALATIIRTKPARINLWVIACFIYAAGIAAVGVMHWCALRQVGEQTRINVAQLTTSEWLRQNTKFTALYLLFPILCSLQYVLLKRLSLRKAVRILASVLSLCFAAVMLCLLMPGALGIELLWRVDRFRGSFVSPNSFAFTAFLLIQWLVVGMASAGGKGTKAWYGALAVLLAAGVVMSGSRTGLFMFLLLMILVPLLFSYRLPRLKRQALRMLAVALPVAVLVVLTGVTLLTTQGVKTEKGVLYRRTQELMSRVQTKGPMGALFQNERRGLHALLAWTFMKRAPVAGWGPGGFYREYANVAYVYTGEVIPAKDSALNHFLMIGGDLGVPLLFLNLVIVVLPVLAGWRISNHLHSKGECLVVRFFALGNAVFLLGVNFIPPSYFPDILWAWTAHLAFLAIVAEREGRLVVERSGKTDGATVLVAAATMGLVVIGSAAVSFGASGYERRQTADWWPWKYEGGCYPEERWEEGRGCWCGEDAFLQIPVKHPLPDTVFVAIAANHPDIVAHPVTLKYGGVSGTSKLVIMEKPGWRTLSIPTTGEYLYEPTASNERLRWKLPMIPGTKRFLTPSGRRRDRYLVLSFNVSRTWVPKEWGAGRDVRQLGIAVLLPDL